MVQRVTTSDNEWQRMKAGGTTNENEWKRIRAGKREWFWFRDETKYTIYNHNIFSQCRLFTNWEIDDMYFST